MLKNILYKLYIGILLGLGIFILNPIKGYCASNRTNIVYNGSITTPATINSTNFSFNVNDNSAYEQYGRIPYSNFDLNLSFISSLYTTNNPDCFLNSPYSYIINIDVLFTGIDGGAYSIRVGNITVTGTHDSWVVSNDSFNYIYNCSVYGIPTGVKLTGETYGSRVSSYVYSLDSNNNLNLDYNATTLYSEWLGCNCSFTNFSFDESSSNSGSSSTIINNVSSNLTPIGYSSLNFGVNGDCHFLGSNYTFAPSYLTPLTLLQDFYNSPQGSISSAPMTLYMNQGNNSTGNPISIIGDTRPGEYEFTLGFCLGSPVSQSVLDSLTNLSNWGFEFARGYSGENFTLPSDTRVSYTYFLDNDKQLYYLNIFFYFTTPNFFDCFIIRSAPTINNIRIGAFSFNKYTGTIADQINQSTEHWEDVPSSHQDFADANSTAASTVSSMADIEDETFSRVDDNIAITGVDDFNLTVMATPMNTVSGLINQVYNVFPDELKYLIIAVLSIGIFAVIIRAGAYANGSNGGGD